MTPNQWTGIGQYTARFMGNMAEIGCSAVRGIWGVSKAVVTAPFIAMNLYIEGQLEGTPLASRKRETVLVPNFFVATGHTLKKSDSEDSTSEGDISETSNNSESSELEHYSESEFENEDEPEAKPYMSLCQKNLTSLNGKSSRDEESLDLRSRARTNTLTLSQKETQSLAARLKVSKNAIKQELSLFNDDLAPEGTDADLGLMAQLATLTNRIRTEQDEENFDDEQDAKELTKSLRLHLSHAHELEGKSLAESLRLIVQQTRKKEKQQKTDIAKQLDPDLRNSHLCKLLKKQKSIPFCEHKEVAAAFGQRMSGCSYDKEQFKAQFLEFITSYQSRPHRLVPALVNLMKVNHVDHSLPVTIEDIESLSETGLVLTGPEKDVVEHFIQLSKDVHQLLHCPLLGKKSDSYYGQICKMRALQQRLSLAKEQRSGTSQFSGAIKSDLNTMDCLLNMKLKQVELTRKNDERKYCSAIAQAEAWEADARDALETLKNGYLAEAREAAKGMRPIRKALHGHVVTKKLKVFKKALRTIDDEAKNLRVSLKKKQLEYSELVNKNELRSLDVQELAQTDIPEMVAMIDTHVAALTGILKNFKGGNKQLSENVIDRLENKAPQGVSHYSVPLMVDGQLHSFQVTFTPAKDFVLPLGADDQKISDLIGFQGRFPCSANRNSEDAQNLTVVEVHDEQGVLVRREVRVGTLVPYLIEDDIERYRITEKRCTQALTMLAAANRDVLGGLNSKVQNEAGQVEPVDLPFSYVCYLSPDKARDKTGLHEDEYQMVNESRAMLKTMSENPRKLTFGIGEEACSETYNVKPKMFVFPVNMLGFNEFLATAARTFTLADEVNDESMKTLIGKGNNESGEPAGEVGEFLASAAGRSLSSLEREELIELCDEFRNVITNRLYHHAGTRPFYPSWLVEQISLRTKQGLLNGCKSAKDRTNNANKSHIVDSCTAHVRKQLSCEGTAWQRLALGKDLSSPEMSQNQTVSHVTCGGLKQQWANCGKAGYKVDGTARGTVDLAVYKVLSVG